MTFIIATVKSWNIKLSKDLQKKDRGNHWYVVSDPKKLTPATLAKIKPRYVFFPHWSWIIPKAIYENYECVVFHMTDLPYGRGGSPLQNLLIRKREATKISALRVTAKLDAGPVYFKRPLDLKGRADEIYRRAAEIIFNDMIPNFVRNPPRPKPQRGKIVIFKRRQPEQSRIDQGISLSGLYDFIRMLDAEGYPKAFLEFGKLRLEFHRPIFKKGKLTSNIIIYEK